MTGRYAQLEPLNAEAHAALLFRAFEGQDQLWHYMYDGPFSSSAQFHRWVREVETKDDPLFYAIKNLETAHIEGVASYLRIAPEAGSHAGGDGCHVSDDEMGVRGGIPSI